MTKRSKANLSPSTIKTSRHRAAQAFAVGLLALAGCDGVAESETGVHRKYQKIPVVMEDDEPEAGGWGGSANEGAEVEDAAGDYETTWDVETLEWLDRFEGLTGMAGGFELFRVRRCLDPEGQYECTSNGNSVLSDSMFDPWETSGVTRDKQNDTYIAVGGQKDPTKVKHLVFMAAGQQAGSGNGAQYQCGLTGQGITYKNPFRADPSLGSTAYAVPSGSLIGQVLTANVPDTSAPLRDLSDTFVGLALDHRLNYNHVSGNEDVVDAYFEWLQARVQEGQLESIIFAGHSRGGNLVTKLAQRFAHEGPADVKIVVQLYESVSERNELYPDPSTGKHPGRHETRIYNPLDREFVVDTLMIQAAIRDFLLQGRWVAWQHAFNRPSLPHNVRVLNLTGGHCTLPETFCVRPVSGMPQSTDSVSWTMERGGFKFYEQLWTLTDHGETDDVFVGDAPNAGTDGARAIRHLFASCRDLGCL